MSVIKPQEINLDFTQNTYKDIVVKQNDVDSRTVIITFTNNGVIVPIDYVSNLCYIEMLTPDERAICNATTILSDGRIQVDFDEQMVLVGGKTTATLKVIDQPSQEIIHTMNLNVIIVSNAYPNGTILATPEFSALTEALLNVGDCTELVRSIEVVEHNEEIRKTNERERIVLYGEMKAAIESIPDGTVSVDFVDQKESDVALIEKLNGISLYVDNNNLKASWDNHGSIKEIDISGGTGGGDSGFNYVYAEKSINLGRKTGTDIGDYSAAIGKDNEVVVKYSAAIGNGNKIYSNSYDYDDYYTNISSVAIGNNNTISGGMCNFITGKNNIINDEDCDTTSDYCVVGGYNNTSTNWKNVILGTYNTTSGAGSIAIGHENESSGAHSIAIGYDCVAKGVVSFASGNDTKANGTYSHTEGEGTIASSTADHAEGSDCIASGGSSHAQGVSTQASGYGSHAEGYRTKATSSDAHAEGYNTVASNSEAHSEGGYTEASGYRSHAEGDYAKAKGTGSHAEGFETIASGTYQHVQGQYNIEDTENKYAHIVGGGESSDKRENIHTLDWDGNAWFSGIVSDGSGATLAGIETSKNNSIYLDNDISVMFGKIIGVSEQNTTKGLQLYNFYDRVETQNGVTATFVNGVCTLTGQYTGSGNYAIDVYYEPIDNLVDGTTYYGGGCLFKIIYMDDTFENKSSFVFDSDTMKEVHPHIVYSSLMYYSGLSFNPMVSNAPIKEIEPYTGGISPNPSYPQEMKFTKFTSLTFENDLGNSTISFDNEIELYHAYNIADELCIDKNIKRLEKITLTGNETINGDASLGYFIYSPTVRAKTGSINVLSDHYKNIGNKNEVDYNIFIDDDGNIRIQHSGFASIDEYKMWLSSNNVEIVYERSQPEIIELSNLVYTALANLKFNLGETVFSTDSIIQPIIEIEYPTSKMAKYVVELLSFMRNMKNTEGGAY